MLSSKDVRFGIQNGDWKGSSIPEGLRSTKCPASWRSQMSLSHLLLPELLSLLSSWDLQGTGESVSVLGNSKPHSPLAQIHDFPCFRERAAPSAACLSDSQRELGRWQLCNVVGAGGMPSCSGRERNPSCPLVLSPDLDLRTPPPGTCSGLHLKMEQNVLNLTWLWSIWLFSIKLTV